MCVCVCVWTAVCVLRGVCGRAPEHQISEQKLWSVCSEAVLMCDTSLLSANTLNIQT